ncbi:MAG: prepilin-type N-terminal cleavage/methylation domain-containing protein [Bacilli bacterium]
MKKINKKGFTLIELLVVIVILIVIMSIAIPSVTSSIERSKAKQKDQVIKLVESSAELYYDSHKNSGATEITVPELIDAGYLTLAEAKDPFYEKRTVCGSVSIGTNANGIKTFTFNEDTECDKECTTGTNCKPISE